MSNRIITRHGARTPMETDLEPYELGILKNNDVYSLYTGVPSGSPILLTSSETANYNDLLNKPTINNQTLVSGMTFDSFGAITLNTSFTVNAQTILSSLTIASNSNPSVNLHYNNTLSGNIVVDTGEKQLSFSQYNNNYAEKYSFTPCANSLSQNANYTILTTKNIYDAYPIGSVICMSSNTNPSTIYGGTWTLVDKQFANETVSDTSLITRDTTNVESIDQCRITRMDHQIEVQFSFTNRVALTDTAIVIGSFNMAGLGVNNNGLQYSRFSGFSDVNNSIIDWTVSTSGIITSVDCNVKGGGTTVSSGDSLAMGSVIMPCLYSNMLDSACNRFYFKRIS